MAGTGYPGPLVYFDSLDPYMVTVDGTMRKKKRHAQAHSSHRDVGRDRSEAMQPCYGFSAPSDIRDMDSGGQSRATWDLEPLL